jgi:hypothetical protein
MVRKNLFAKAVTRKNKFERWCVKGGMAAFYGTNFASNRRQFGVLRNELGATTTLFLRFCGTNLGRGRRFFAFTERTSNGFVFSKMESTDCVAGQY